MDEGKLWELFFVTGLPEAYLAIRQTREEKDWQQMSARQAFQADGERAGEI